MSRKFNPSRLFERWKPDRRLAPYPTFKARLDAVQSGKKGMEYTGLPIFAMTADDRRFREILREAFVRNLAIVLHNRGLEGLPFERQEPRIFIARPEELWRIPAYIALWETAFVDGAWSNASEALEGLLLGYTTEQRALWLASNRHDQPARGCRTVYALLSEDQRQVVHSVGKRCFGPAEAVQGLALFFPRDHVQLRSNAFKLLPKGTSLARAGLEWRASNAVFGQPKKGRGVVTATLSSKHASATNAGLRSNVQFLTRSGWE